MKLTIKLNETTALPLDVGASFNVLHFFLPSDLQEITFDIILQVSRLPRFQEFRNSVSITNEIIPYNSFDPLKVISHFILRHLRPKLFCAFHSEEFRSFCN